MSLDGVSLDMAARDVAEVQMGGVVIDFQDCLFGRLYRSARD